MKLDVMLRWDMSIDSVRQPIDVARATSLSKSFLTKNGMSRLEHLLLQTMYQFCSQMPNTLGVALWQGPMTQLVLTLKLYGHGLQL